MENYPEAIWMTVMYESAYNTAIVELAIVRSDRLTRSQKRIFNKDDSSPALSRTNLFTVFPKLLGVRT